MYKNGEVEGKWVDYNKDGSIRDQGEVINGSGEFRTYLKTENYIQKRFIKMENENILNIMKMENLKVL